MVDRLYRWCVAFAGTRQSEYSKFMTEPIVGVRMELRHIRPKIWRRVDVPLSSTLMSLHEIIQVTMGWASAHLFEFRVGGLAYGLPRREFDFAEEVYDARSIQLQTLVDNEIKRFTYDYDFGDDWEHRISVGKPRRGAANIDYPAFVKGARRCPPEDVGGVYGYEQFLAAMQDPSHEEHEELTEWYESFHLRPFDPEDLDIEFIQARLAAIARKRR